MQIKLNKFYLNKKVKSSYFIKYFWSSISRIKNKTKLISNIVVILFKIKKKKIKIKNIIELFNFRRYLKQKKNKNIHCIVFSICQVEK